MEYFTLHEVLTRNAVINMIIGHRSAGKTYSYKDWAIRDFLKNGKQFIYLRRNRDEVAAVKDTLFNDIVDKYNIDVRVEGKNYYLRSRPTPEMTAAEIKKECPWQIFGYIMPLSLQQMYKSSSFPQVNKICLDEFIIENHRQKYLENEVQDLLSFYYTVDRGRNDVRLILLSNSGFISNPYFQEYNVKHSDLMKSPWCFRNNKKVLIYYYQNEDNSEEIRNSNLGAISTDRYKSYAIDNEFADASDTYIIPKKPKGFQYYFCLTDGSRHLTIHKLADVKNPNSTLWIKVAKDMPTERTYSVNPKIPILNTPFNKNIIGMMKQFTYDLLVVYESPEARNLWYEFLGI